MCGVDLWWTLARWAMESVVVAVLVSKPFIRSGVVGVSPRIQRSRTDFSYFFKNIGFRKSEELWMFDDEPRPHSAHLDHKNAAGRFPRLLARVARAGGHGAGRLACHGLLHAPKVPGRGRGSLPLRGGSLQRGRRCRHLRVARRSDELHGASCCVMRLPGVLQGIAIPATPTAAAIPAAVRTTRASNNASDCTTASSAAAEVAPSLASAPASRSAAALAFAATARCATATAHAASFALAAIPTTATPRAAAASLAAWGCRWISYTAPRPPWRWCLATLREVLPLPRKAAQAC